MYKSKNLLSVSADAKTVKGETFGFLTGIMYLAPYKSVQGYNMCSMAEIADCGTACLATAGRGAMSNVAQGRLNKSIWFINEQATFMSQLVDNVKQLINKAKKQNKKPLIRLNGTSDIRWENISFTYDGIFYENIFAMFPAVQFYDYTKIANRKDIPANYDLTFSYSGVLAFQPYVNKAVKAGMRVAVVFRSSAIIPTTFRGMECVNGDNSDIRHLDAQGVVVALYAKGKGKTDTTGFVVDKAQRIINIMAV